VELRPPSPEEGDAGLQAFREAAKLHEDTLRSRMSREFYRKDLAKWQKLYTTLAGKRDAGSQRPFISRDYRRSAVSC
jgi:hypothetical protein